MADGKEDSEFNASRTQVLAVIATSMCSAATGFALGYSAPALDSLGKEFEINETERFLFVVVFPLGGMIGSILSAFSVQFIGRKRTIMASAPLILCSYLMLYFSADIFPMIVTGRFLTGFSVGLNSIAVPVYLEEVLQPRILSRLGLVPTIASNFSIVVSYFVGYFANWSALNLVGSVYSILFIFPTVLVTESPTLYVDKGYVEKATSSLNGLRLSDNNNEELNEIIQNRASTSFRDAIYKKKLTLLKIAAIVGFQQFTAATIFVFVLFQLFKEIHMDVDYAVASIVVAAVNVIAVVLAIFTVNRIHMKTAVLFSFFTLSAMLATLGSFYYHRESYGDDYKISNWLPLTCLMLHNIAFSAGAGPLPWLMIKTLNSGKERQIGVSTTTVSYWTFCFMATTIFMKTSTSFLGLTGALLLFALVSVAAIPFIAGIALDTVDGPAGPINVLIRESQKTTTMWIEDIDGWIKTACVFMIIVAFSYQFRNGP